MSRRATGLARWADMQRGQSTIEFGVFGLVLAVLIVAVPLVGTYLDLIQTTEASSRYVAFEGAARNTRSTWKTDAQLSAEVRRRFFSNSDAPVKTNDTAGDFTENRNPLWTDNNGNPLLDDFAADVTATTTIAGKQTFTTLGPLDVSGDLGLSTDNLYSAKTTVKPVNIANFTPFDALDLSISRSTVLLTDAWTGFGHNDIAHRIENGGLKVYPIGPVAVIIDGFGQLPPTIFDPALKANDWDWDVVPCDRIGGC